MHNVCIGGWIARMMVLATGLSGCATSGCASLGEQLEHLAQDSELRAAVLCLAIETRESRIVPLAQEWLDSADPALRRQCYRLLISVQWSGQREALLRGLEDPAIEVRGACAFALRDTELWDSAISDALWKCVATSQAGYVVAIAAEQLVWRGGRDAAVRVYEILAARGQAWPAVALRSLVRHPLPLFRDVFENAYRSSDPDESCLGCRGLLAIGEDAMVDDPALANVLTLDEWHELWAWENGDSGPPSAMRREDLFAEARAARVVIIGEWHGVPVEQASQIWLMTELFAVHGGNLVLVYEVPIEKFQRPVILVAEQCGIGVRALETASLTERSVHLRDEEARERLKEMVTAEPGKIFLVIYGANHLRSLHAAMRESGVPSVPIVCGNRGHMLTDAIKSVGWRIQDYVFRYGDGVYYVPIGSYGTILCSPKLDEVLLRGR